MELFKLNGVSERPLSRLIPIEIGASELRILITGQGLGKGRPMVEVAQMDCLMEEDVVQGVGRCQLEAI